MRKKGKPNSVTGLRVINLSSQIINESPFKNLVEQILTNRHDSENLSKKDLLFEIIKWQKLDLKNAKTVFVAMEKLGLENCHLGFDYDIQKFALMRNYFSESEIERMVKQTKGPKRKRR